MNFSALFIQRPIATSLLTVAIVMAGAIGYILLPEAPLPQVDFPTIQVNAGSSGRKPRKHGVFGHDTARTAIRPDCGHHRDDVDEPVGVHLDHAAVRP